MENTPDYIAGKTRDPRNPPVRPGKVAGDQAKGSEDAEEEEA